MDAVNGVTDAGGAGATAQSGTTTRDDVDKAFDDAIAQASVSLAQDQLSIMQDQAADGDEYVEEAVNAS